MWSSFWLLGVESRWELNHSQQPKTRGHVEDQSRDIARVIFDKIPFDPSKVAGVLGPSRLKFCHFCAAF